MLAAGHTLDGGGDGLVAFVHIIRRDGSDGAARLIYTNGDGLAVVQGDGQRIGDVSHQRAVFIHKAGGVDDIAALSNGGSGGQNHIDFVDGVVDGGGRAAACNFQFFEVAASGFGDLYGLGALVDEHIIGRRRHGYGADGFASLDRDRRTVIQLQRYISASFVGKRGGVRNLSTLVCFGRSRQRYGGRVIGAWVIGNSGIHCRSARDQVLEMLAAGHAFDSRGDGLVALVHIIRRYGCDGAARLIHTDGDGLAIVQRHGQRVGDVGHRRAVLIHKAGGVDDVAAFTNGGGGRQDHINLVDGVVDRGRCAVACHFQFFEVAASGFGDLDRLAALIDEHIIGRRWHGHGANSVARFDGDRRAVIQLQGDVSTGLVAQGRGVGDLTTFVNGIWRSQRDSRSVIGTRCVSHSRGDFISPWNQIFKVLATGHALDGGSDSLITFVDVIRCKNRHASARLVYANGDGLAVIQSHGQRVGDVGHRRAVFIHKAGGVDDVAAFANGGGGRQDHIYLVDSVVDGGGRAVACYFEFFEVATSSLSDLDRLGALIDEHVIGRRGHGYGADGFASLDGDRRAVIQLQRYIRARFIGKRGGVSDLTTFVCFGRRRQSHGGGVVGTGGIGDSGVHRRSTRHQVFKVVTAGHAFDSGGNGLIAFVHIVWR